LPRAATVSPTASLRALERLKGDFGGEAAPRKLALLLALERARLARAAEVLRLHEVLCFLRAYPDDAALLECVDRMLEAFERRADLRRHRHGLADSGIAGTEIRFRFFSPTAQWLARRWPAQLRIEWKAFDRQDRLGELLPILAHASEQPGLDECEFEIRRWVDLLRGPRETDAAFLIRRMGALGMDEFARETLYDQLDPPLRLLPGPGTPARTRAKVAVARVAFQRGPLARERPVIAEAVRRPPLAVRAVSPREGARLIDLARAAMATRERDLDVFSWGDPRDVRIVECGEGLQFAMIGAIPERRLMLEAVYGFLTLKNGVPLGYVLTGTLFGSCEVAYNVFETYRGAEAGPIYGRVLSMCRHLFGAESFMVPPYQLGHGNAEAIDSGAWWFYQKLGFRARDAAVRRLMREELARMRRDPRHRSDAATLRKLAARHVYFHLGRRRDDVLGLLPLARVGLHVTAHLAREFGSDRERGEHECAREAGAALGVRSTARWPAGERLAWRRWAPLVCVLPGAARWSAADRRALIAVIRAKGGRRESDFVRRFDGHRSLRRVIVALAVRETP
jgi:hypothetical protein